MNSQEKEQVIGIVKNGFFISADTKNPLLLTETHMQEATTPESGKIDLKQYEGKALMVSAQRIDDKNRLGCKYCRSCRTNSYIHNYKDF